MQYPCLGCNNYVRAGVQYCSECTGTTINCSKCGTSLTFEENMDDALGWWGWETTVDGTGYLCDNCINYN